jgi:UDP-glucuronate decarboxylase
MLEYKNILVTGGAGFIGTNLCKALLSKTSASIICLDNLYSGKIENINLHKSKKFKFINHDVRESFDIKSDLIINLACPASPIKYQEDKVFTAETSLLGIINVCKNAKKYSSKIIHASTSEVYGDPLVHPQNEDYYGNVNINGIRSCYDEGKRFAETYLLDYCDKNNLQNNILRIFNTYGPYMAHDDGRVVSNFIMQALRNENITIYGSGSQTRSLCFVDDLVNGIMQIAKLKNKNTISNIGNDKEVSILKIAELIIELTNSNSILDFYPLPQNDPLRRRPDLERIKKLISWSNLTNPEVGIKKTIKYFKSIDV